MESHLQLNDALEHCNIALNDRACIWNGASILVQLEAFWIVVGPEANEDADKWHKDDESDHERQEENGEAWQRFSHVAYNLFRSRSYRFCGGGWNEQGCAGLSSRGDEPLRRRHVIWRTEHSILAIPIYYAVQQFAEPGVGRVEARHRDLHC